MEIENENRKKWKKRGGTSPGLREPVHWVAVVGASGVNRKTEDSSLESLIQLPRAATMDSHRYCRLGHAVRPGGLHCVSVGGIAAIPWRIDEWTKRDSSMEKHLRQQAVVRRG